jgi:hypothetical protein
MTDRASEDWEGQSRRDRQAHRQIQAQADTSKNASRYRQAQIAKVGRLRRSRQVAPSAKEGRHKQAYERQVQ